MARLRIAVVVAVAALAALLVPAPSQAATATAMKLTAPLSVERAAPYTLSGTLLGGATGTDPIVGVTVTLVRTDLKGSRTIYLKTTSSGFSYVDTPAVGGLVTWKASWPGNALQTAATATRSVRVSRLSTSLSVRTDATVYAFGSRATVTVHLGKTYNNREVQIFAKRLFSGKTAFVAKGRVNAAGNFTATYGIISKTVFTAKFVGDYRYAPTARTATVNVRPKISVATYMTTGRSGDIWYASKTGRMSIAATIIPSGIGSCAEWVLQEYSAGAWRAKQTLPCVKTNFQSESIVFVTSEGTTGFVRLRVYAPVQSYRLDATGPWVYVKFV